MFCSWNTRSAPPARKRRSGWTRTTWPTPIGTSWRTTPTAEELRAWHERSGLPLKRFFNTSGMLYREMELSKKLPDMPEDEQYTLLATNGMLVKRPLLVTADAVIPGFKEATWEAALGA